MARSIAAATLFPVLAATLAVPIAIVLTHSGRAVTSAIASIPSRHRDIELVSAARRCVDLDHCKPVSFNRDFSCAMRDVAQVKDKKSSTKFEAVSNGVIDGNDNGWLILAESFRSQQMPRVKPEIRQLAILESQYALGQIPEPQTNAYFIFLKKEVTSQAEALRQQVGEQKFDALARRAAFEVKKIARSPKRSKTLALKSEQPSL